MHPPLLLCLSSLVALAVPCFSWLLCLLSTVLSVKIWNRQCAFVALLVAFGSTDCVLCLPFVPSMDCPVCQAFEDSVHAGV